MSGQELLLDFIPVKNVTIEQEHKGKVLSLMAMRKMRG
jgi:hypothetical protein